MIRRATGADVAEIARLATQLGGVTELAGFPSRLQRILEAAAHAVFVAVNEPADAGDAGDAPALHGFAAAEHRLLLPFGEWVELVSLVVDADARRHGLGTQLVAAVEAWAARRGVSRVVVRSSVSREGSHDFYPALGYARLKTQHVYIHDTSGDGASGDGDEA